MGYPVLREFFLRSITVIDRKKSARGILVGGSFTRFEANVRAREGKESEQYIEYNPPPSVSPSLLHVFMVLTLITRTKHLLITILDGQSE
jgi:hypothetical protein